MNFKNSGVARMTGSMMRAGKGSAFKKSGPGVKWAKTEGPGSKWAKKPVHIKAGSGVKWAKTKGPVAKWAQRKRM